MGLQGLVEKLSSLNPITEGLIAVMASSGSRVVTDNKGRFSIIFRNEVSHCQNNASALL